MLVISSDGTSSDDALPAAEYANGDFQHNIIAISVRKPATDLLSKVAGLPTRYPLSLITDYQLITSRVIHLDQWSAPNELFDSWVAYITCDYATASTTRKSTTPKMTTLRPYGGVASKEDATNIELIPLSPSSISVSWTCCTNNKSVREIDKLIRKMIRKKLEFRKKKFFFRKIVFFRFSGFFLIWIWSFFSKSLIYIEKNLKTPELHNPLHPRYINCQGKVATQRGHVSWQFWIPRGRFAIWWDVYSVCDDIGTCGELDSVGYW